LDNLGQSFYSPKLLIQSDLKTNPLPATVRIQKLLPTKFDPELISFRPHLSYFRGFRAKRRNCIEHAPASEGGSAGVAATAMELGGLKALTQQRPAETSDGHPIARACHDDLEVHRSSA
jgi:hypothetical protein